MSEVVEKVNEKVSKEFFPKKVETQRRKRFRPSPLASHSAYFIGKGASVELEVPGEAGHSGVRVRFVGHETRRGESAIVNGALDALAADGGVLGAEGGLRGEAAAEAGGGTAAQRL